MSEEPQEENTQTLIDHLIELRARLLKSLTIFLLLFLGLFYFSNEIYQFLSEPLRQLLPAGSTMIATGVTSPFFAPMKLTVVAALLLAMPVILHQAWAFISPGLYRHEKKIALPLLIASIVLFYAGIAFAYYVVFPVMLGFFTSIGPTGIALMPDINDFLDVALKLLFAFGCAFEIPIVTFLLIASGIVSVETLVAQRSYVIVGCFVVGMLLTPPDVFSQTFLAVPMWMLFELGIVLARLIVKPQHLETEDSSQS